MLSLILAAVIGQVPAPSVSVYQYRIPSYEVVESAPQVRTRVVQEVVQPPPVLRQTEETVNVTVTETPAALAPLPIPALVVPVTPLPEPWLPARGSYKFRYRERVRFGR